MKDSKLFGRRHSPFTGLVESYIYIARLHRTVLERQLNKTGVYRSQHQLLMYIADNPNESQKQLAQLYRVSTATIAVSLKKLEQGGYISRAVDQQDNRCNKICITEKGRKAVEKSECYFGQIERMMFRGFTQEDAECLQNYLDRIKNNLCSLIPEEERKSWENEVSACRCRPSHPEENNDEKKEGNRE